MSGARVHPFDLIARVLAERLQGCAPSEELRGMVRSPGIDWERVVTEASDEYVLPALAAALRDLDLSWPLDHELVAFLDTVHAANIERNAELRDELRAAVGILNRVGIEPVLLKGTIRLLDGLYPDDGWRMLCDLDLLVPEAALADAGRVFAAAGYEACGTGGEIRRRDGVCQIDLHTELFSTASCMRLLPGQTILADARPARFGGGKVRIPSAEHQLVHVIGHSQLRHLGHAFGRVALRHRLEAAALAHRERESIDWQAVLARFSAVGYRRPLLSFLLALSDGDWCAAPVTERVDPLTALQRRRIALQARSTTLAYLGSQVGWWVSALGTQIQERDGGQRKAIANLKRLIFERGGIRKIARAFLVRREHLMHLLPYLACLIWFIAY
jgi:hypothetical protein